MQHEHEWSKFVALRKEQGLLAKELYMVHTRPAQGTEAVLANLKAHLAYQCDIEAQGIMFAAGPLADEKGERWTGEGLIIIRAASLDGARVVADADPMHKSGARVYTIRPWLMNEGAIALKLRWSDRRLELA
jgi:uncharacterized protein YciI